MLARTDVYAMVALVLSRPVARTEIAANPANASSVLMLARMDVSVMAAPVLSRPAARTVIAVPQIIARIAQTHARTVASAIAVNAA